MTQSLDRTGDGARQCVGPKRHALAEADAADIGLVDLVDRAHPVRGDEFEQPVRAHLFAGTGLDGQHPPGNRRPDAGKIERRARRGEVCLRRVELRGRNGDIDGDAAELRRGAREHLIRFAPRRPRQGQLTHGPVVGGTRGRAACPQAAQPIMLRLRDTALRRRALPRGATCGEEIRMVGALARELHLAQPGLRLSLGELGKPLRLVVERRQDLRRRDALALLDHQQRDARRIRAAGRADVQHCPGRLDPAEPNHCRRVRGQDRRRRFQGRTTPLLGAARGGGQPGDGRRRLGAATPSRGQ